MTERATAALDDLERARSAYSSRSWLEAHAAFSRADDVEPLEAEDLELLTTATLMLGRDDDALGVLERAHHRYLERGETSRAVRAAAWMGINLAQRGAVGPASGWLGRAQRLLEQVPGDSAEHGYLLLPLVFQREAAGDFEGAAAVAGDAAAIGQHFGDRDLFAISLQAQGYMLMKAGRVREGFGAPGRGDGDRHDRRPVALRHRHRLLRGHPRLPGGVRGRPGAGVDARADAWADEQPDLVAFTGRCRIHRAEILQLGGSWSDALEEARRACQRLVETKNVAAAGVAYYRQGELLRLRGEFEAAEEAYREASRFGWEPQPGLAQLRLAQGKPDAALAAIRRAFAESSEPLKRAAILPAQVEIALAAGEIEEARSACNELEELARRYESAMLTAMVAHAKGVVALAEEDCRASLVALREAQRIWLELDTPYEVARTRALLAEDCSALDDSEAAALELASAREIFQAARRRTRPRPPRLAEIRPMRTGSPAASSKCCGSSQPGRAIVRSRQSW